MGILPISKPRRPHAFLRNFHAATLAPIHRAAFACRLYAPFMPSLLDHPIYALPSLGSPRHLAGPATSANYPPITTFLGDTLPSCALNLSASMLAGHPHAAAWSGTVADELFEPAFRTWSAPVRAQLHETLDRLLLSIPAQATLTLRPHARHILADHHLASRFISSRWSRGETRLRLLMDPASLFTRQMFPLAEDHLTRMIEQAADLIRFAAEQLQTPATLSPVAGVLLAQVIDTSLPSTIDPMDVDDGPPLTLAPISHPQGRLPTPALLKAVESALPAEVPLYLLDTDLDSQLALLQATR
jgi:hypothetical protein